MSRPSIVSCYMTMVSHWDIFIIVLFVANMAQFNIFKIISYFLRNNRLFIEILFNYLLISFCFSNKTFYLFINSIFSSIAIVGFTISLSVTILTYYFVTITTSLVFLICFSVISMHFIYWNSYTLKIGINNKWGH